VSEFAGRSDSCQRKHSIDSRFVHVISPLVNLFPTPQYHSSDIISERYQKWHAGLLVRSTPVLDGRGLDGSTRKGTWLASLPLATRSLVHYRCLRSNQPAAVENKLPAPSLVAPSSPHRTSGICLLRIGQNSVSREGGSTAHKTDGWQGAPGCKLQSRVLPAGHSAFPSP